MKLIKHGNELIVSDVHSILYQEKPSNFLFPIETHDFWELIYLDKGFVYLLVEGKGYKVNQGELMFFSKGQSHTIWSDSAISPYFFNISFDMEFTFSDFFEFKKFVLDTATKDIFTKILSEHHNVFENSINSETSIKKESQPVGSDQLVRVYITEFLLKLYQKETIPFSDNPFQTFKVKDKSENAIFNKSVEYIKVHLYEEIYLEQLHKNAFVSASSLNKIFNNSSGLSVMEYVNFLKLETSKEMLRKSNLNITQISNLFGFSSVHYFSHLFKSKYNISPREYSKSIKSSL